METLMLTKRRDLFGTSLTALMAWTVVALISATPALAQDPTSSLLRAAEPIGDPEPTRDMGTEPVPEPLAVEPAPDQGTVDKQPDAVQYPFDARHVWVTYYSGVRAGYMDDVYQERLFFITAVNGGKSWAKVRLQIFDSYAQLLHEADQGVGPGHSSQLRDSEAFEGGVEYLPENVTVIISSDQPVTIFAHEQEYQHKWRWDTYENESGSERESNSRRHIAFEKLYCPVGGQMLFCEAHQSVTPWDVWK
jgi:hypothetical protein